MLPVRVNTFSVFLFVGLLLGGSSVLAAPAKPTTRPVVRKAVKKATPRPAVVKPAVKPAAVKKPAVKKPAPRAVAKPALRKIVKPVLPPGKPLTSVRRTLLFACMLLSHNNYNTFNPLKKRVVFAGRKRGKRIVGEFAAGFQTIFYDSQMIDCMARLSGTKRARYDDITPIQKFTGLRAFGKKQGSQGTRSVNFLNPKLIQWSKAYLIPNPSDKVLGYTYQQLYNVVGQRFFRFTALTYEYLSRKKRFAAAYKIYSAPGDAGMYKIRKQFRPLLRNPVNNKPFASDYLYHAGHAATFWMRREMDGTRALVWNFFKTVLQRYDFAFSQKLSQWNFAAPKPKVVTITAKQARQLPQILASLTDGSTLQFKPGMYVFDKGLTLANKQNITLKGLGEVWILVKDTYADVLTLRGSTNITVDNLKMRHVTRHTKYQCEGAVIAVIRSNKVWIKNSTLNGSGAIGVRGYRSNNLIITNNLIHTNSMTAIMLDRVAWVAIHNNSMVSNGSTLYIWRTHGLRMSKNTIGNNKGHTPLSTPFMRLKLGY